MALSFSSCLLRSWIFLSSNIPKCKYKDKSIISFQSVLPPLDGLKGLRVALARFVVSFGCLVDDELLTLGCQHV